MSHSGSHNDYGPGRNKKALASFVAGTIISGFKLLISVFSFIFRALASLA